jgi:hypothetical protein
MNLPMNLPEGFAERFVSGKSPLIFRTKELNDFLDRAANSIYKKLLLSR